MTLHGIDRPALDPITPPPADTTHPGTASTPTDPQPKRRAPTRLTWPVLLLAAVTALAAAGIAAVVTARTGSPSSPSPTTAASVAPPAAAAPPAAPSPAPATVVAQVLPSTVAVLTTHASQQGGGTGIIFSADGLILTNSHVVADADTLTVQFTDGRIAPATVVGLDRIDDIAVLKTDVTGLRPIRFGRSATLRAGQDVIAVGAPYGLDGTVTTGVISAVNRPVTTPAAPDPTAPPGLISAIQTDAALNPGSSGGPLLDRTGAVIGINSIITSAPSTAQQGQLSPVGIGFAIPIDHASRIAAELVATGHASRADPGATIAGADWQVNPLIAPPTVQAVTPGGGADRAGLRAGDLITALNGQTVHTAAPLLAALAIANPGSTVRVTYQRGAATTTTTLTLGSTTVA